MVTANRKAKNLLPGEYHVLREDLNIMNDKTALFSKSEKSQQKALTVTGDKYLN